MQTSSSPADLTQRDVRLATAGLGACPDSATAEELLARLDLHVLTVALCAIASSNRLFHPASADVVVHYVLKGEGWLEVEGSPPQPFAPNGMLIVPPGKWKRIGIGRGGKDVDPLDHCWRAADGLLIVDLAGQAETEVLLACASLKADCASNFGLFERLAQPIVEDLNGVASARAAVDMLLLESAQPQLGSRALISTLLKQCMILALRRYLEGGSDQALLLPQFKDPRLARTALHILDHPGKPHSIDGLASKAGMSRSAFVKKFSECFRRSPMEFVAAVRLEEAAHLLSTTSQPIKCIADAVGFASRSHFSRAFRARYGADPSSYRSAQTSGVDDQPVRGRTDGERRLVLAE